MERTDLLDTDYQVHRERVLILRERGAEWRLQQTFELCDLSNDLFAEQTKAWNLRQMKKHGIVPMQGA